MKWTPRPWRGGLTFRATIRKEIDRMKDTMTGRMSAADAKAIRRAAGLTQRGLAARLGMSAKNGARTVRRWEHDGPPPDAQGKLEKIRDGET